MNRGMRNAEGYYDPTAGIAVYRTDVCKNLTGGGKEMSEVTYQAGDIVEYMTKDGTDCEAAILAVHEDLNLANVIRLGIDPARGENIEVISKVKRYADINRPFYIFLNNIVDLVRTLPDDTFRAIRSAVAEGLNLQADLTSSAETVDRPIPQTAERPDPTDEDQLPDAVPSYLYDRLDEILDKLDDMSAIKGVGDDGPTTEDWIRLEAERDIWKQLYEQERERR